MLSIIIKYMQIGIIKYMKLEKQRMNIGKRIKSLRIANGFTQSELAEHCRVSRAAVAQWETGKTKGLKAENLLIVSEILYIDPWELMFGSKSSQ